MADRVIDTSKCNIHDLRRLIVDRFGGDNTPVMLVTIESFGFKHGLPRDADLVFDVRFLPNPHYLPGGKELTGTTPRSSSTSARSRRPASSCSRHRSADLSAAALHQPRARAI
jgi:RNase adaptor protein for sRNA GlmZ degradation